MGLEVGQVLQLDESAYRYGRGDLRLTVTSVGVPFTDRGQVWVPVHGVRLLWHDVPDPAGPRIFAVLVSALK